jgi:ankyrin repeat protein
MICWETQIIDCVARHNSSGAIQLLKQGFPINYSIKIRTAEGSYEPGHTSLLIASILFNLVDLCEFLLKAGSNTDTFDSQGRNPAHLACRSGNNQVLRLLITFHADLTLRDAFGNTLLHIAAINKHLSTVELLVEKARFPVVVLNKSMQRPVDACKATQEECKSLGEAEELERIIQYLWRKEEEYKKKTKEKILKNSLSPPGYSNQRTCRLNKQGIDHDMLGVPMLPFKKAITVVSPFKGRQTIQGYLKDKHEAIFKDYESRVASSNFSQMFRRSPSPGIKLPMIKKMSSS